jgi:integrase/recombinase XerC
MTLRVREVDGGYRIIGDWEGLDGANAFLAHLCGRGFSPATVRAYAFDVLNLARFLTERDLALAAVDAPLVFDWIDWIDWQGVRRPGGAGAADRGRSGSAAPSTVNRRVAAVRALFEYLLMTGRRVDNPVPSPRRGQGLRRSECGLLGHLGPGRARPGGRLVRQPRLRPESLPANDIEAFIATLGTHRDRRWCWRCCWAGCGRRRCGTCCWRMRTWVGGGCG